MSRTPPPLSCPGHAIALLALVMALLLPLTLAPPAAAAPLERFFRMGSGELHLLNHRNEREARVQLLAPDHSLSEAALTQVDRVFGFPTREKGEHISPRLLFLLSYFADRVAPGGPSTSNPATAARNTTTTCAKAGNAGLHPYPPGRPGARFLDRGRGRQGAVELVRAENCSAGVGHYGGRTIHLDAGRPRFWKAATSGTRARGAGREPPCHPGHPLRPLPARETVRLSLSSVSTPSASGWCRW